MFVPFSVEQVKVVVEQVHLKRGLVDCARRQRERLAADDLAFVFRARKVRRPMRGPGLVAPLVRADHR